MAFGEQTMKKLMDCEYCGGRLEPAQGSIWLCGSCGRYTSLSTNDDSCDSSSSVKSAGKTTMFQFRLKNDMFDGTYLFSSKVELVFKHHRRVTRADRYPGFLLIDLDGGGQFTIGDCRNFNISRMTICICNDSILMTKYPVGSGPIRDQCRIDEEFTVNDVIMTVIGLWS